MATPHSRLAIHEITVGRDWRAAIIVDPVDDQTASDVVTEMTGATCTARILGTDGTTVITSNVTAAVDAANREITLTMSAANTTGLAPGIYRWDVKLTTPGGGDPKVWPIAVPGFPRVRALG